MNSDQKGCFLNLFLYIVFSNVEWKLDWDTWFKTNKYIYLGIGKYLFHVYDLINLHTFSLNSYLDFSLTFDSNDSYCNKLHTP